MSDEYINREMLLADIEDIEKRLADFGHEFTKEDVLRYIKSTCRVLKIVRCKDCVFRGTNKCFMECKGADWTSDFGFCHIGKRKGDQNE